ncbi:MAG: ABC transporter permease [Deltaproteobacteria bacterium]|nr:ABC transporter permease [Deltaproteobacteria bacterium]
MEITSLARYGIKSARRDWKRSGWLVLGVMLGLAFFVAISSLGASYSALVKLPFERIESDLIIQLGARGKNQTNGQEGMAIRLPFSNQPIDKKQIKDIASLPGVKSLNPAVLLWHQEKKNFVTLAGIDPGMTSSGPAKAMEWIKKGRGLKASGETVVESHHAKFHKLVLGDIVQFQDHDFRIVGIATIKEGASLAAANFYISLNDAQLLATMEEGSANLLSIGLKRGVQTEVVQEKISALLPGAIVSSTDSIGHMMRGFAGISSTATKLLSSTALGFTILLACWLIVGCLQEQRWQIGLMQTLGWQKKDIILTCGAQSLILTLAGGLAGIGLGLLIVQAMGSFEVALTLPWNLAPTPEGMQHGQAARTMQVPLPIVLQPAIFFVGLAVTCLAAVIISLIIVARQAAMGTRQTLFEQ